MSFFYLDTLKLSININGHADARNYSGEDIKDIQDAPLKLLLLFCVFRTIPTLDRVKPVVTLMTTFLLVQVTVQTPVLTIVLWLARLLLRDKSRNSLRIAYLRGLQ